jgi:hypothetical protein
MITTGWVSDPRSYFGRVSGPGIILRGLALAIDERHVALPKLYGAPAYTKPPLRVEVTARPFDPDDLPIAAVQTVEERDLAASDGLGGVQPAVSDAPSLRPKPLSLRAFAGRILGNSQS